MHTIELEVPDELANKPAPYQDHLAELLALGLQQHVEREQQERLARQDQLLQALAASGKVERPQPYSGQEPYVRHTPVPITGEPVSKIIIKQRGPTG
jgi:hypothetical protein